MFCSQCGCHNIEGSRFCTNCGAPLQEGAAPASGAAPGFSGAGETVSPHMRAPAEHGAAGPAAPPPSGAAGYSRREYRAAAGVRVLRSVAGSPLFLLAAAAFTASIIAGYFVRVTVSDIQDIVRQAMELLKEYGVSAEDLQGLEEAVSVEVTTGSGILTYLTSHALSILTAVGLFLTWAAAKAEDDRSFSTSGLTILQIVSVIEMIIFILLSLVLLLVSGAGAFLIASGADQDRTTILVAAAVILVVLLVILLFPFLYFKKIIGMLGTAKKLAAGHRPGRNASVYVAVILLFSALYYLGSAATGYPSGLLSGNIAARINAAAQAVSCGSFGLLIFSFRKKIREEWL